MKLFTILFVVMFLCSISAFAEDVRTYNINYSRSAAHHNGPFPTAELPESSSTFRAPNLFIPGGKINGPGTTGCYYDAQGRLFYTRWGKTCPHNFMEWKHD